MNNIKIAAMGDIAFVGRYDTNLSLDPFVSLKDIFQTHDLVIGNLESALTFSDCANPYKCSLRSNPVWSQKMKQSGINVLSLANNHVMDYGVSGLIDTIENLTSAGISIVGAGLNSEQAETPLYLEIKNKTIALIGRSDVEVKSYCYAEKDSPGVARLNINKTIDVVNRCKQNADLVILILHWGLEHYVYPSQTQRNAARSLIEAGVDIIVGHHPHVLQGIENVGDGIVIYSLGNFVFDDFSWEYTDSFGIKNDAVITLSQEQRETAVVSVDISFGRYSGYDIIPVKIQNDCVLTIQQERHRYSKVMHHSIPFKFPLYRLFWKIYAIKQEVNLRLAPIIHDKVRIRNLKKIRLRHFTELFKIIKRSASIARENKTNPYD
jgi:poly-gamma-glutamate capsule biosynthesis protein CapA/YwtB (metallophosphatase superfamily)